MCFRKSIMETCKIFSPSDRAVILVKSMWHHIRQWDRMQRSRVEKLSKVILALRSKRKLYGLQPWRLGGGCRLIHYVVSTWRVWSSDNKPVLRFNLSQLPGVVSGWKLDGISLCNRKYRWQGWKSIWAKDGFQRQRVLRLLLETALTSQSHISMITLFL